MSGLPAAGDAPNGVAVNYLGCRADPFQQPRDNGFLNFEEGRHIEEVFDFNTRQIGIQMNACRHVFGKVIVAIRLASAVAPLRQTDNRIGRPGTGQEQRLQRIR